MPKNNVGTHPPGSVPRPLGGTHRLLAVLRPMGGAHRPLGVRKSIASAQAYCQYSSILPVPTPLPVSKDNTGTHAQAVPQDTARPQEHRRDSQRILRTQAHGRSSGPLVVLRRMVSTSVHWRYSGALSVLRRLVGAQAHRPYPQPMVGP
jgi:hypothetical protein